MLSAVFQTIFLGWMEFAYSLDWDEITVYFFIICKQ